MNGDLLNNLLLQGGIEPNPGPDEYELDSEEPA